METSGLGVWLIPWKAYEAMRQHARTQIDPRAVPFGFRAAQVVALRKKSGLEARRFVAITAQNAKRDARFCKG